MFLLVPFQEERGQFISTLTFADIRYEDAGEYSCSDQTTSVTVSQLIYLIGQCQRPKCVWTLLVGGVIIGRDGLFCCLY